MEQLKEYEINRDTKDIVKWQKRYGNEEGAHKFFSNRAKLEAFIENLADSESECTRSPSRDHPKI